MELLAVIVLLGILGLIVIPVVDKTIKDSRKKAYEAQIYLIEDAANKWGVQNSASLPAEGDVLTLSFEDIQKGGLLKGKDIKDPRNGKELNGCVYVQYDNLYHQYNYQYQEECDELSGIWKAPVITVNGKTIDHTIRLNVTEKYTIPKGTAVDYEGNRVTVTTTGTISPTIPGEYEIIYKATDRKGISSSLTLIINVVDLTKPTVNYTIANKTMNGWYNEDVKVVLNGTDNGKTPKGYEYQIDTGNGYNSWQEVIGNSFTIKEEGLHIQFQVRSKSSNSKYSEVVESTILKIDQTKPEVTSTTLNITEPTEEPVILMVAGKDELSGIKEYSFDNGATWQSENTKQFDKNQTVSISIKDQAGNVSLLEEVEITNIRASKPYITYETVGTPFNNNGWANTNFYINIVSHTGKNIIKENSFQYCMTTNGTECEPNIVISDASSQAVEITTEGEKHKICAVVTDNENQTSDKTCSNLYKLDKTKPVLSRVSIAKSGTTYYGLDTTLTITGSDALSGLSEMNISNDGYEMGIWENYNNTKSWKLDGTLDGETRTVYVELKDKAGNISLTTTTSSKVNYTVYEEGKSATKSYTSNWSSCSCPAGVQTRTYDTIDNNTKNIVLKNQVETQNCTCNPVTINDFKEIVVNNGDAKVRGTTTYFYGENPNNWIKFNNELWRIISIEEGMLKIIRNTPILQKIWDKNGDTLGSNVWTRPADINTYLNGTYYNGLSAASKAKIKQDAPFKIGIIPRTTGSITIEQYREYEAETIWNGKVGLKTRSDYLYAYADESCPYQSIDDNIMCYYDNWLFTETNEWNITGIQVNPQYIVHGNHVTWTENEWPWQSGFPDQSGATVNFYVRPVVYLLPSITVVGAGTQAKPFTIQ